MTNPDALRDRMLAAVAAGLASALACGSAACGKEDATPLGPSTALTARTTNACGAPRACEAVIGAT